MTRGDSQVQRIHEDGQSLTINLLLDPSYMQFSLSIAFYSKNIYIYFLRDIYAFFLNFL